MNDARADALAARSHLAAHGWIPRNAEAFRHLPPPDAALWLGERDPLPPDPAPAPRDWELGELSAAAAAAVDARWLDAANPAQRRELLAGPAPGGRRRGGAVSRGPIARCCARACGCACGPCPGAARSS